MASEEFQDTSAEDPDPVIARYSVFLKPQLPAHQKLLVLQYPNKVDKAAASSGAPSPVELRIKSGSGMVEVDMPLDYSSAYDRAKGMAWGAALASSTKAKAGGSHGLAGGFGLGGHQGGRTGRAAGGAAGAGAAGRASASAAAAGTDFDGAGFSSSTDWAEAVRQDRVLRLQTLGGMCPPSGSMEARYMMGVFDGGNLHLTPVHSVMHLRPQLHHIDAEAEGDRLKHRDGGGASDGGAAGSSGGRGEGAAAGGAAARAIHMTIKSAGADGVEVVTETMADRLRAVQTQAWSRMAFVGDDDERSWDVYDQTFFLRESASQAAAAAAAATAAATPTGASETTPTPAPTSGVSALAADSTDSVQSDLPLSAKVPSLRTAWKEDDVLQAISGLSKPVEDESFQKEAATRRLLKGKGKEAEAETGGAGPAAGIVKEEPGLTSLPPASAASRRGRPGRPAASAPAASAPAPAPAPSSSRTRTSRARQAGSARGNAMDLD